jgi:hypothetical protein
LGAGFLSGQQPLDRVRSVLPCSQQQQINVAADTRLRNGTWFDPGAGRIALADYFENPWFPNRVGEVRTRGELPVR